MNYYLNEKQKNRVEMTRKYFHVYWKSKGKLMNAKSKYKKDKNKNKIDEAFNEYRKISNCSEDYIYKLYLESKRSSITTEEFIKYKINKILQRC